MNNVCFLGIFILTITTEIQQIYGTKAEEDFQIRHKQDFSKVTQNDKKEESHNTTTEAFEITETSYDLNIPNSVALAVKKLSIQPSSKTSQEFTISEERVLPGKLKTEEISGPSLQTEPRKLYLHLENAKYNISNPDFYKYLLERIICDPSADTLSNQEADHSAEYRRICSHFTLWTLSGSDQLLSGNIRNDKPSLIPKRSAVATAEMLNNDHIEKSITQIAPPTYFEHNNELLKSTNVKTDNQLLPGADSEGLSKYFLLSNNDLRNSPNVAYYVKISLIPIISKQFYSSKSNEPSNTVANPLASAQSSGKLQKFPTGNNMIMPSTSGSISNSLKNKVNHLVANKFPQNKSTNVEYKLSSENTPELTSSVRNELPPVSQLNAVNKLTGTTSDHSGVTDSEADIFYDTLYKGTFMSQLRNLLPYNITNQLEPIEIYNHTTLNDQFLTPKNQISSEPQSRINVATNRSSEPQLSFLDILRNNFFKKKIVSEINNPIPGRYETMGSNCTSNNKTSARELYIPVEKGSGDLDSILSVNTLKSELRQFPTSIILDSLLRGKEFNINTALHKLTIAEQNVTIKTDSIKNYDVSKANTLKSTMQEDLSKLRQPTREHTLIKITKNKFSNINDDLSVQKNPELDDKLISLPYNIELKSDQSSNTPSAHIDEEKLLINPTTNEFLELDANSNVLSPSNLYIERKLDIDPKISLSDNLDLNLDKLDLPNPVTGLPATNKPKQKPSTSTIANKFVNTIYKPSLQSISSDETLVTKDAIYIRSNTSTLRPKSEKSPSHINMDYTSLVDSSREELSMEHVTNKLQLDYDSKVSYLSHGAEKHDDKLQINITVNKFTGTKYDPSPVAALLFKNSEKELLQINSRENIFKTTKHYPFTIRKQTSDIDNEMTTMNILENVSPPINMGQILHPNNEKERLLTNDIKNEFSYGNYTSVNEKESDINPNNTSHNVSVVIEENFQKNKLVCRNSSGFNNKTYYPVPNEESELKSRSNVFPSSNEPYDPVANTAKSNLNSSPSSTDTIQSTMVYTIQDKSLISNKHTESTDTDNAYSSQRKLKLSKNRTIQFDRVGHEFSNEEIDNSNVRKIEQDNFNLLPVNEETKLEKTSSSENLARVLHSSTPEEEMVRTDVVNEFNDTKETFSDEKESNLDKYIQSTPINLLSSKENRFQFLTNVAQLPLKNKKCIISIVGSKSGNGKHYSSTRANINVLKNETLQSNKYPSPINNLQSSSMNIMEDDLVTRRTIGELISTDPSNKPSKYQKHDLSTQKQSGWLNNKKPQSNKYLFLSNIVKFPLAKTTQGKLPETTPTAKLRDLQLGDNTNVLLKHEKLKLEANSYSKSVTKFAKDRTNLNAIYPYTPSSSGLKFESHDISIAVEKLPTTSTFTDDLLVTTTSYGETKLESVSHHELDFKNIKSNLKQYSSLDTKVQMAPVEKTKENLLKRSNCKLVSVTESVLNPDMLHKTHGSRLENHSSLISTDQESPASGHKVELLKDADAKLNHNILRKSKLEINSDKPQLILRNVHEQKRIKNAKPNIILSVLKGSELDIDLDISRYSLRSLLEKMLISITKQETVLKHIISHVSPDLASTFAVILEFKQSLSSIYIATLLAPKNRLEEELKNEKVLIDFVLKTTSESKTNLNTSTSSSGLKSQEDTLLIISMSNMSNIKFFIKHLLDELTETKHFSSSLLSESDDVPIKLSKYTLGSNSQIAAASVTTSKQSHTKTLQSVADSRSKMLHVNDLTLGTASAISGNGEKEFNKNRKLNEQVYSELDLGDQILESATDLTLENLTHFPTVPQLWGKKSLEEKTTEITEPVKFGEDNGHFPTVTASSADTNIWSKFFLENPSSSVAVDQLSATIRAKNKLGKHEITNSRQNISSNIFSNATHPSVINMEQLPLTNRAEDNLEKNKFNSPKQKNLSNLSSKYVLNSKLENLLAAVTVHELPPTSRDDGGFIKYVLNNSKHNLPSDILYHVDMKPILEQTPSAVNKYRLALKGEAEEKFGNNKFISSRQNISSNESSELVSNPTLEKLLVSINVDPLAASNTDDEGLGQNQLRNLKYNFSSETFSKADMRSNLEKTQPAVNKKELPLKSTFDEKLVTHKLNNSMHNIHSNRSSQPVLSSKLEKLAYSTDDGEFGKDEFINVKHNPASEKNSNADMRSTLEEIPSSVNIDQLLMKNGAIKKLSEDTFNNSRQNIFSNVSSKSVINSKLQKSPSSVVHALAPTRSANGGLGKNNLINSKDIFFDPDMRSKFKETVSALNMDELALINMGKKEVANQKFINSSKNISSGVMSNSVLNSRDIPPSPINVVQLLQRSRTAGTLEKNEFITKAEQNVPEKRLENKFPNNEETLKKFIIAETGRDSEGNQEHVKSSYDFTTATSNLHKIISSSPVHYSNLKEYPKFPKELDTVVFENSASQFSDGSIIEQGLRTIKPNNITSIGFSKHMNLEQDPENTRGFRNAPLTHIPKLFSFHIPQSFNRLKATKDGTSSNIKYQEQIILPRTPEPKDILKTNDHFLKLYSSPWSRKQPLHTKKSSNYFFGSKNIFENRKKSQSHLTVNKLSNLVLVDTANQVKHPINLRLNSHSTDSSNLERPLPSSVLIPDKIVSKDKSQVDNAMIPIPVVSVVMSLVFLPSNLLINQDKSGTYGPKDENKFTNMFSDVSYKNL